MSLCTTIVCHEWPDQLATLVRCLTWDLFKVKLYCRTTLVMVIVLSCLSLVSCAENRQDRGVSATSRAAEATKGESQSNSPVSNVPCDYRHMADVHFHHLWKTSPDRVEDLPLKLKVKYCNLMESIELIDQHVGEGDFPALDKLYSGGWVSWDQRSAVIARWGARSGVVKERKRQMLLQLQHPVFIPRKRPGKSRQSRQARALRKAKLEANERRKAKIQSC